MLTLPEVRRYSTQSGLRDMMIAEKEVVLTFLLQLLSERGIRGRRAMTIANCSTVSTDALPGEMPNLRRGAGRC